MANDSAIRVGRDQGRATRADADSRRDRLGFRVHLRCYCHRQILQRCDVRRRLYRCPLISTTAATLALPSESIGYINETVFVGNSQDPLSHVRLRLIPSDELKAIVCFTDGTSQKWIDLRTNVPAPAVAEITNKLARRDWRAEHLRAYLQHEFWDQTSDDDRGVAYLFLPEETARRATHPKIPTKVIRQAKPETTEKLKQTHL